MTVAGVVEDAAEPFDVAILDLQIGSMGGMAVTMSLRLDESSGRLPHVPVLMLLDRVADVHLAKRSGADGWLVKPLDPLRLRRAVRAVPRGGAYREGLVDGAAGAAAEDAPPSSRRADAVEPADVAERRSTRSERPSRESDAARPVGARSGVDGRLGDRYGV